MPNRQHFDFHSFSEADLQACQVAVRELARRGSCRQHVAENMVEFFLESFRDTATARQQCVLARCFQTCAYARLPLDYRDAADRLLADISTQPEVRCLSLLATRGRKTVWNSVATSTGHQAIPLPSVEVVRQAPMIARMLDQFSVSAEYVAKGDAVYEAKGASEGFKVFHVPDALGSPYLPAQLQFVQPHGVKSVLGVGGLLPEGELLAILLFTRVPVSAEAAEMFGRLGMDIRAAMLPFTADQAFERPS